MSIYKKVDVILIWGQYHLFIQEFEKTHIKQIFTSSHLDYICPAQNLPISSTSPPRIHVVSLSFIVSPFIQISHGPGVGYTAFSKACLNCHSENSCIRSQILEEGLTLLLLPIRYHFLNVFVPLSKTKHILPWPSKDKGY